MSISKKERSFSIWIGIAIGVALSSMLVRYALEKKETQTKERPGNYESLQCASGGEPFHPLPEPIKEKIPYGIVVYFENNQTTVDFNHRISTLLDHRVAWLFSLGKTLYPGSGTIKQCPLR